MQSQATVTTADLARELAKDCRTLEDIQELLKNVFKDTVQAILDGELDEHLGYEKHNIEGNNTGNSRNGYSKKKIKTAYGPTVVDVPRG
jgi:putative transposase